jgi:hypothetical protein
MAKIKIVHCKESTYDVLICRGTPWGNPFTYKKKPTKAKWIVSSRKESILSFRKWVFSSMDPEAVWIRDNMHLLKGKTLGCYCKSKHNPKACHGEVYADLLDDNPFEDFFD